MWFEGLVELDETAMRAVIAMPRMKRNKHFLTCIQAFKLLKSVYDYVSLLEGGASVNMETARGTPLVVACARGEVSFHG